MTTDLAARVSRAKTHRGKRFLEKKAPKLHENDKSCLFVRGGKTNETVTTLLKDLYKLKKENSTFLKRHNPFHPFTDETGLEKFSSKYDASLFLFGSHQKKRPNNLVMGRMFDGTVLDMIELGVENFNSLESFQTEKCSLGSKPVLNFNGESFQQDATLARLKSLLIDFFRGPVVENLRLQGVEHTISFTVLDGKILMRSYRICLKKSGTRLPRVELEEMGPSCDFVIRRTKLASDDNFKNACKQPPQLKVKKVKNVSRDVFGTQLARIHLGKQDLSGLQTRKTKALRGEGKKKGKRPADGSQGDVEMESPNKRRQPERPSEEGT